MAIISVASVKDYSKHIQHIAEWMERSKAHRYQLYQNQNDKLVLASASHPITGEDIIPFEIAIENTYKFGKSLPPWFGLWGDSVSCIEEYDTEDNSEKVELVFDFVTDYDRGRFIDAYYDYWFF